MLLLALDRIGSAPGDGKEPEKGQRFAGAFGFYSHDIEQKTPMLKSLVAFVGEKGEEPGDLPVRQAAVVQDRPEQVRLGAARLREGGPVRDQLE